VIFDELAVVIHGFALVLGHVSSSCFEDVDLEVLDQVLYHFKMASEDSEVERVPHRSLFHLTLEGYLNSGILRLHLSQQ